MCGVVRYGVFGERHVWYGGGYNGTWNTMVDIGDKRKLQDRRGEERTGEERTGEESVKFCTLIRTTMQGSVDRSAG